MLLRIAYEVVYFLQACSYTTKEKGLLDSKGKMVAMKKSDGFASLVALFLKRKIKISSSPNHVEIAALDWVFLNTDSDKIISPLCIEPV